MSFVKILCNTTKTISYLNLINITRVSKGTCIFKKTKYLDVYHGFSFQNYIYEDENKKAYDDIIKFCEINIIDKS